MIVFFAGDAIQFARRTPKQIRNDVEKAKILIASGAPVVACIAPSFIANYSVKNLKVLENALNKLGFDSAEDTAQGATVVKKNSMKRYSGVKRKMCSSPLAAPA